ncbi:hypothetical protein ABMA28_012265 [Loxostege sticticalis]|uniref:Integrase catalytic domain-containing protein n=1 Tax=Loxostege sticticalis TaxID=481309 RepID=A0ABD0TM96_LOXSC
MTDIKELRALRGYSKSSLTRLTKLADDLGETSLQRLLTRRDRLKEVFAHMNRSTNIRNLISEIKQHLAALKNLNEPVESWNSVVVCIIMRKLDLVTSRAFQLDRNNKVLPTVKELLEYLEKRTLALETTDSSAHKPQWQAQRLVSHSVTAQQGQPSCLYCKSIAHKLFQCPNFKLASQNKRVEFAIANKICKICLTQHNRKCKYHFKCAECKREHNTLLHGIEPQENASPSVSLLSSTSGLNTQVLLPTAQVKLTAKHGKQILARALLDSGSQVSLVTNKIVGRLGLSPVRTNTHIVGITNIGQPVDKCINLELQSMVYPFKINVDCHIVKTITTQLPQTNIDLSSITFPANCKLADATFNVPGDVDLLLGADVFFQVLLPQPDVVSSPSSSQQCATPTTSAPQPSVIHTAFGVVVAGRSNTKTSNQVVSLFCNECNSNINDNLSAFWSTEKVPEIFPEQLPEHDYCERLFKDTTVLENNKFTVTMPTKVPLEQVNSELGESFPLALKRFYNLEKRLQRDPVLLTEYTKFIHQYISLKHGTIVDISSYDLSKDPVYFLPHHAVIKESSKTTKLRTVFDGSMRTTNKVSLNDLLLNGPVVQKDLFEVLLSFRLEKYYFICDIRMMFRCIELDPLQRPLQNILWRDSPDQDILCIQLNTVTYGLKPSSYLATRCLIELADRYQDQFPLASQILKNNTYVDDVLSNSDSQQTLTQMQDELVKLLSLGGFQLHKWASNCSNILSNVPKEAQHFGELDLQKHDMSVKTLGVTFHVEDDVFKTTSPEPYTSLSDSKREILSHISKFYDPMGLIGPILVQAKLIMQCLWASNTEWDSIPAPDIRTMWSNFVRDLHEMKQVSVPRCVKPHDTRIVQLIGFADASSKAHGCCLYLRTVDAHGKVHVELLCSKSRINPLRKQLTIPRLELNAAVLLSDLTSKVAHILSSKTRVHDIHLFSDSQIVLAWLQTDATKLQTYVANRVRAITEHAHKNCHWHYVNTEDNPSDCLSRGLQPHELECNNLWWHGPSFLFDRNYNFQSNCELPIELPELKFPKDNIVCVTVTSASDLFEELKKFSNINKMIRVLAYVLRFCNNIKPQAVRQSNFLSSCELNKAMRLIIKYEQGNLYQLEIKCLSDQTPIKGSLKPLSPFLDGDGIIRVGGRLNNAPISYAKQHPIILPKDSDITVLIIRNEHLRLLHAGQKLVLSSLRQRFWIVDGLRTVKKILHKCVTCFRMKAAATTQLMGSLPADRVTACRPFQKIGTDFAGPVAVKNSRIRKPVIGKGYIVLFVCFVTKAIHLELASDLTTDAFLACFKRFISRRNLPSDVYCDNGSTYKGARNKLDELYRLHASQSHQTTVQTFASEKGIDFHFIPSYSPIFGGLWESGVKSVKYHLKRIVGKALLTYEQLNTVLVEIEGVLNSRPLTAVTSDPNDLSYLSPGHFLTGAPLNCYPERDLTNSKSSLIQFWSVITNMKQNFWKCWSNNYLTMLQNRPKWRDSTPNVAIGSLVILRNDNAPPLQWPMARITNLFPGKDGKVRAVEVKTSNGHKHNRSITKICVLPL